MGTYNFILKYTLFFSGILYLIKYLLSSFQDRNLESFQDKSLLNHHSSLYSSAS